MPTNEFEEKIFNEIKELADNIRERHAQLEDTGYVCSCCGCECSDDYMFDDEVYCQDCFYEHFAECDCCSEVVPRENLTDVDGESMCDICREENAFLCPDCDELHNNDSMTIVFLTPDRSEQAGVCENCLDDYRYCEHCGEYFSSSCGEYDDDGDYWYCYDCRPLHHYLIGNYHSFNRSKYRGRGTAEETITKDTLFMGVELEVDYGTFEGEAFQEWLDQDELIHFERDGSLDSGVECITMPCTLKFHQEEMKWDKLLNIFKQQQFRSHDTTTCGLHVHLSRKAFKPLTITKLDVFLHRAWWFFSQIGRRKSIYNANPTADPNRKISLCKDVLCYSNTLCYRSCLTGKAIDLVRDMAHSSSYLDSMIRSRYQIVNTSREDTVELRHAKGTLNYSTLMGTLEMYHALVFFLENKTIKEVQYETQKTLMDFIYYVLEKNNEYPHITGMMHQLVRKDNERVFSKTCNKYNEKTNRIANKLSKKGK
jgi:hypothetical protein